MSSTFPQHWPTQQAEPATEPNIISSEPSDSSPTDHDMPPRRTTGDHLAFDDGSMESIMRMMVQSHIQTNERMAQAAEAKSGNGDKRMSVILGSLAVITLLGSGANFLASSGILIGGKNNQLETVQKQLDRVEGDNARQAQQLREYEVWLQTTREKLADKGWQLPPLPKGR